MQTFTQVNDVSQCTTTGNFYIQHDQDAGTSVASGVDRLTVLNTTRSEFWGFQRDRFTTLAETKDRVLATEVSAWWRYRTGAPLRTQPPLTRLRMPT